MTYAQTEDYILAALFNTEPKQVPRYASSLKEDMFSPRNRGLFNALITGERDMEVLAKAGNRQISDIVDFIMGENNFKFLTEGLIKDFKQMALKQEAEEALLGGDYKKLSTICHIIEENGGEDPMELYKKYKEEFRAISNRGLLGASTGIRQLDYETKGIIPGHIWVCGAYYGMGKTYMAINLARSMLEQGKRVLFISLEMPVEEIIQRFVSLLAGIDLIETSSDLTDPFKISARINAEKFIEDKLKDGSLILDSESRTTGSVLSTILRENLTKHVDLVTLDYIQLLAEKDNQYASISDAVQRIQGLAKQTKSSVLLLSQVNNDSAKMGSNRDIDGFKGAGDIGQVANVAMRIERDRDPETGQFTNRFCIRLTKIRYGRPGKVELVIDFPGGKIREPRVGEIQEPVKKLSKYEQIMKSFEDDK